MPLSAQSTLPTSVHLPEYVPENHGRGIVHLGIGAFHRAHQAVYTDDTLAASGGNWRTTGVNLRSTQIVDALNAQDGRYTLVERGVEGSSARIIASLDKTLAASREPGAVIAAMVDPATRIVSLTISEKAYGLNQDWDGVDSDDPVIASDLAYPQNPTGAIGLIVETLRLRRQTHLAPYTVLCCDNLPGNGTLVGAAVVDFARRLDPQLANWIEANVAFPSTMVDRITPATTKETLADATRLTGCADSAAIETERFSQWVIEDNFPMGRPAWETAGAIFVPDVAPYEQMKLRMLNGSHSMLAYTGFLAGQEFVRDVMKQPELLWLTARHLKAAASTLAPLSGIDFATYANDLIERFKNPAIAHATYQIAMDGSQKLPQRLLYAAVHALENGMDIRPFAFAIAAWMRYCLGQKDDGTEYALRDPLAGEIANAVHSAGQDPQSIVGALQAMTGLFPEQLKQSYPWNSNVVSALSSMLESGMSQAIIREARM